MVAAFAAITRALTPEAVQGAIQEKFSGTLRELNAKVVAEAFEYVASHPVLT
jgi:Pyruvate/2-oxoacid:ferredoxin oxidoreductase gamma subunit